MELDTYRRYTAPKTIVTLKADVEKARKWFIHEAGDFEKSKVQLAYYRSWLSVVPSAPPRRFRHLRQRAVP